MPDNPTANPKLSDPIGMSLSGGGFRAAAFHLGSLSYLEHVGLLPQLRMLSTVSGGSFTGAKFALSQAENIPFEKFFKSFYSFMHSAELMKQSIDRLAAPTSTAPSGRNTYIMAMAQTYEETFLKGSDGRPASLGQILDADIPLQEVIINSTEFRHGLDFRFQKSTDPKARIGNAKVSIPKAEAGKIRLADAVAASGCFPGGFEPFAFPDDFIWPEGKIPAAIRDRFSRDGCPWPLPLMDGGIYDNQGIGSIILADKRQGGVLGMMIISDVFQTSDDYYNAPLKKMRPGWLTLGKVDLLARAIGWACALTVLSVGFKAWQQLSSGTFHPLRDIFLYAIPLVLAGGTAGSIYWLRRFIDTHFLKKIPQIGTASWNDFKNISVNRLADMVNARLSSMMALTTHEFMVRIRSLIDKIVYSDNHYRDRRVANYIYHLKSGRPFDKNLAGMNEIRKPGSELRNVATTAADMYSSLWFDRDKPWELPCLVASGHFTLCYNLLKHVVRVYGTDPSAYSDEVRNLWLKLAGDWNQMVQDPYALLHKRLPGMDLPLPPKASR